MKQIKTILLASSTVLLFTGCGGPKFDPKYNTIVSIGQNLYRIPYGARSANKTLNSEDIKKFQLYGLNSCKEGDLFWGERKSVYNFGVALKEGDPTANTIMQEAIHRGKMGCVHPMSDREKQQHRENAVAVARLQASTPSYTDIINKHVASMPKYTPQSLDYPETNKPKGYMTRDAYGTLVRSGDCYTTKNAYGAYVKTCK